MIEVVLKTLDYIVECVMWTLVLLCIIWSVSAGVA